MNAVGWLWDIHRINNKKILLIKLELMMRDYVYARKRVNCYLEVAAQKSNFFVFAILISLAGLFSFPSIPFANCQKRKSNKLFTNDLNADLSEHHFDEWGFLS